MNFSSGKILQTRFAGGQANIYVYVGNDPVNFLDPSGLAFDSGVVLNGALTAATLGALGGGIFNSVNPLTGGFIGGAILGGLGGGGAGALDASGVLGNSPSGKAFSGALSGLLKGGLPGILPGASQAFGKNFLEELFKDLFFEEKPGC